MDGYAVRAADARAPLPIAFRAAAGEDPLSLPPGHAAGITTGGVVPDGADAVVPVERATERDGLVHFDGQSTRATTCARSAATSAAARRCCRRASRSSRSPWRP